jgi:hypothetical protein
VARCVFHPRFPGQRLGCPAQRDVHDFPHDPELGLIGGAEVADEGAAIRDADPEHQPRRLAVPLDLGDS